MYSRKRGWRWSHRWQDEKGFSSLLTGLLANNTQDDKRQNGHPHNYKGLTLSCLMGDQQHQVRCYKANPPLNNSVWASSKLFKTTKMIVD